MNKNQHKYVFVKNKIKEDIKHGVIVDKLPGERTLAKEFGISYMTARKAVEELCAEGILYKIPTKGTYVNTHKIPEKKTHNIGFFLDDRITKGISSPYYSLIFNALEKEVSALGYNLIFFSKFDDINPLNKGKKVDGMIISCFPRLERKLHEVKGLMPIVAMDNSASDKSIPSVIIDNFNGSVDAVNYLVSLGHSRIGYIAGLQDSDVGKDRKKGYISALESHGIQSKNELIYKGDYSYRSGEKGTNRLLSLPSPPTAIKCANDTMALGALKVIRDRGLSVPDDISVIGFDDIAVASQIHPPLTTIAAPIKKIVSTCVVTLLALINGSDLPPCQVALPARLVPRHSCARIQV